VEDLFFQEIHQLDIVWDVTVKFDRVIIVHSKPAKRCFLVIL
jgi:hypothetical protein